MTQFPLVDQKRWFHCLGVILAVIGGLLLLFNLAALRSEALASQAIQSHDSPQGASHYVSRTGMDTGTCSDPMAPCFTLQYAIDQAGYGDSILVAAGIYTEVNDYGGLAQVGYIDKSIYLRGGYDPGFTQWNPDIYTTTLDAGEQGRVLYITGSITPTVEGFLITHGDATGLGGGNPDEDFGGGIAIVNATATISDCKITDNYSYWGGGMGLLYANESVLMNNFLTVNQARYGSAVVIGYGQVVLKGNSIVDNIAIYGASLMISYADVIIEDNTIARNTNPSDLAGGIFLSDSTMTVTNNRLIDNEGVAIFLSGAIGTTIEHNLLSGNAAGVFCMGGCSNISLIENRMSGNANPSNDGVGIYFGINSDHIMISGNTISNYHANQYSGGIHISSTDYGTIVNNTIVENTTALDGGGIYIRDGNHFTVTNNIITNNRAGRYGGGIYIDLILGIRLSNNNLRNNWAGQSGGGLYATFGYWDVHYISNSILRNEAGSSCGGLRTQGGELVNNLIADNLASIYGSGICLSSQNTLIHNTFTNNSGGDGSGIYASGNNTTINAVNTILVNQSIGLFVNSGAQATLDSTLWYGNGQNWSGTGVITTTNDYTGDPGFLAPASGNYHIGTTSAAKDIGVDAGVTTDFEGDVRPQDGGFDLGFDEFSARIDFSLHKQAIPDRIRAGDPLTYVLSFANQGTVTATQVLITDIIPAELENYSIASTLPITPTGGAPYTWAVDPLAPVASGVITITGFLRDNLPEGHAFTNTAEITTTSSIPVVNPSDDVAFTTMRTNSLPVAVNDEYPLLENTTLLVPAPGVMQNDLDEDGDALATILDTGPVTGLVDFRSDGSFDYLPPPGFYGIITYTYHLSDGLSTSNLAQVQITISPDNTPPVAVNDTFTTSEDTSLQVDPPGVMLNDQDNDGDSLTAILDSQLITGELTLQPDGGFTYSPPPDFNGAITFTYHLSDGLANSNNAQVLVNVTPVNDPPIANNDEYTLPEDTPLMVSAPGVMQNDLDIDGDELSAILGTAPITGWLTLEANGGLVYIPPANYNGVITFTYFLSDGLALSNNALVTMVVTPANDPPQAVDDQVTTSEDTSVAVAVLVNDFDIDGDPLSLESVGEPLHGNAFISGTLAIYTPTLHFNGSDVFSYTISDGHNGQDTAQVTITVERINDPPTVEAGEDKAGYEGTVVLFGGSYTDDGIPGGEQVSWDFGDGVSARDSLTPTHTFVDNGIYTVTLTVTDSEGAAGQDWLVVSVENVAPTISSIPDQIVQVGQPITLPVEFIDPGWLDTHDVVIEWEPGITDTLSLPVGTRQINLTYTYSRVGSYQITVFVSDDDGGKAQYSFMVDVIPLKVYLPVMRK